MRPFVVVLGTLLILACARVSNPQSPVGCWHLSFSRWRPPIASGDQDLYQLPEMVELTTRPGPEHYYEGMRRPNQPPHVVAANVDSLRAFWKPLGTDSIELWLPVWWSTGIRARLRHTATRLAGSAEVYVDMVGRPVPHSVVAGQAIGCRAT